MMYECADIVVVTPFQGIVKFLIGLVGRIAWIELNNGMESCPAIFSKIIGKGTTDGKPIVIIRCNINFAISNYSYQFIDHYRSDMTALKRV